ncbi:PREDICTED: retinoic acid receptor responder protein 2 isoform X1 [Capra hircus]|uniref:retinoic acid receptor responder protein 2 isoform X1 n=1 Tax=Capra hircus TaxID=9925 RepID=UPI0008473253|nr:PREDICTED: retinoic acid receptor responder protein 2 isoform X1 [Capra hircus]XP_017902108.1 PREDICTED: retinoic acid receptor responder protein 2 isoform X1 [Capra hircus]XP_017902109.1 PREDICTED: retinoic acid receptor responder protein 2 isoform X1 [Capra hircus]
MWQLLLPLALGLGSMGLGRAELTAAQHRGLQVALEEFHKHPPVQWAFQVTSVDNASDTLFPAGQFVRLEFKLQQTSCRKKDWRKADCKVKPNGRKRKCLACIKLDSKDQVLGRMVHCPIQTQVQRWPCAGRSWTTPRTPSAAGWSASARTPTATTFPDSSPSSKPCPPELRPGGSHPASWKEGRSPVKACLPPLSRGGATP